MDTVTSSLLEMLVASKNVAYVWPTEEQTHTQTLKFDREMLILYIKILLSTIWSILLCIKMHIPGSSTLVIILQPPTNKMGAFRAQLGISWGTGSSTSSQRAYATGNILLSDIWRRTMLHGSGWPHTTSYGFGRHLPASPWFVRLRSMP